MARVKRGTASRKRHNRILKSAKGYRGGRHRLIRTAKDTVMRALRYSYRDRRVRKREFRQLWIARINAAARAEGMTYSRLAEGLRKAGVAINRKMLADMAVNDAPGFKQLVETAKSATA